MHVAHTTRSEARNPNENSLIVTKHRKSATKERLLVSVSAAATSLYPVRPDVRYAATSTTKAGAEAPRANQGAPSSRPNNVSKPAGSTNGRGIRNLNEKRQRGSGQRNNGRKAEPHDWHLQSQVLPP